MLGFLVLAGATFTVPWVLRPLLAHLPGRVRRRARRMLVALRHISRRPAPALAAIALSLSMQALFIVISGGGYIQVGEERTRVNHGEAVLWPANVPHGAYTDGSEMRAIVIELPTGDSTVLEGQARAVLPPAAAGPAQADAAGTRRAQGRLADRPRTRDDYDRDEGEPW